MSNQSHRNSLDPLLLERLAEAGFLASECGMHEEAATLFRCMAQLKPGNPSPLIALAMALARAGSGEQAIEELKLVIAQHPDSEMAKAVLGMIMVQRKQSGALELFEEVFASAKDKNAINVANSCIELAREQNTETKQTASESLEFFRYYNVIRV